MSIVSNHYPEVLDEMNARPEPDPRERVSRKPRPKPERRIKILAQPTDDTDGWAAVAITVGKKTDTYLLHSIPTDFAGTLAFEVEKLDNQLATVEQYHVTLADQQSTCECKGHLRHGHCKHVEGLAALTSAGKL